MLIILLIKLNIKLKAVGSKDWQIKTGYKKICKLIETEWILINKFNKSKLNIKRTKKLSWVTFCIQIWFAKLKLLIKKYNTFQLVYVSLKLLLARKKRRERKSGCGKMTVKKFILRVVNSLNFSLTRMIWNLLVATYSISSLHQ